MGYLSHSVWVWIRHSLRRPLKFLRVGLQKIVLFYLEEILLFRRK
jgi:hypothetical protein